MRREDFPILKRGVIYFDNAATSQKPRQVIEAIEEYYKSHNANIHRGIHTLSEEATELYEQGKERIAAFFGASSDELVITKNSTEALNLVAFGQTFLQPGDRIIITIAEHHANILPWQVLAKRMNLRLDYLFLNEDYQPMYEELEEKEFSLLAFTQVSNVLGTVAPVKEMIKLAKDKGALTVVDASQSAPHLKIDFHEMGADFLAFTGHKMLGPMGTGGLLARAELLEEMEPLLYGGDMIEDVEMYSFKMAAPPQRFEAGTQNVAGVVGLTAAVDYLSKLGMDAVERREKELTQAFLDLCEDELFGPTENRLAVFSFPVKEPRKVSYYLNKYNIAVRAGLHCAHPLHYHYGLRQGTVRASLYFYNTEEEIQRFFEVVKELKNKGIWKKEKINRPLPHL